MSIELTRDNPWRPPDWRWQRASLLAAGELRRNRKFDDRHVQRLERFARTILTDDSPGTEERLASSDPGLFWAYRLFKQDEMSRKADLEARVIANQLPHLIAKRTGLMVEAVDAYELAFYDVRDKLEFTGYVLHTLLGTAMHRGLQERDYPLVWKYLAHTYGPYVFEAYLNQSVKAGKPRDASGVMSCLADAGFAALLRKQMMAATGVPLNQFTQTQVLDIYAKFVEINRAGGQGNTAGTDMLTKNVEAVLALMPLDIGPYTKPQVDGPMLSKYDASSEEMSTTRLLLAAQGQLSEDDGPQNLKYPEPNNYVRIADKSSGSNDSNAGSGDRAGGDG